ncbi:o-fucosyltransferase 1 [Quercus suber]|uniref:O-fucosyltransferase family protein n=1 Tax=Quercus suber TaxID=58331 RepID=A0AAW0KNZ4_QUESU
MAKGREKASGSTARGDKPPSLGSSTASDPILRNGFYGIYDVEHFISTLRFDVRIVERIPEIRKNGKTKKIKAFQLSQSIVDKLRSQGHFMSIHLRFEMDMLAFAGCLDIFTPKEQGILKKYRKENFAPKVLNYGERRAIGKCPLTPEEVGLILRAMGFDNSTRIYLAAGELFGGDRFMKPFRTLFPHLENHSSVEHTDELVENTRGLLGSAVDYMVCLLSDIFMPTYDGPSNFANNLLGHRLYYGFRTTIRPDRKALAPIFIDRENGRRAGFDEAVRRVMLKTNFGGPHKRVSPESFYTNSWPECFCQTSPQNPADKCPPDDVLQILSDRLKSETTDDLKPLTPLNLTVSEAER